MKKRIWKPYVLWIGLSELVGAIAAFLIRNDTELYRTIVKKPPLSPPGIVFPIVWTILYLLMGIGMARVMIETNSDRKAGDLRVFLLQLAFNFFWSIWFFKLRAFGFAFVWLVALWALILWMILRFRQVDRPAARMQAPYLVWVTFAGYLNAGVWLLNRGM